MKKLVILPNHITKRIYWNENGDSARCFILIGYCPDTLAYFIEMAKEAQKSFPDLDFANVTCSKVSRSPSIYGFTLITFAIPGPKRDIKGWQEYHSVDFNY